ncbi:Acetylcholine receptor subunit beta [Lamellibrachia satsuma]|nr:Acetylcholine receptor subunit beta [Lamellibrachia satsuma]
MIRMSAFYQETLLLPAVLIAILTMCMFFVPPATGERIVFGVGLLLASVFLLLNLEDVVSDDTGEVPIVAIYLAFDQVMLTAGIILSVIVYNCHYRNVKRSSVPDCLKTVFLGRLSRLLCVPAEPYTRLPRNVDAELDMTPFPYDTDPPATTDAAPAGGKDRALEATLDDIRKYLRICAAHATSGGETGSHHQVVLNEWIQMARVVDRLLFAIFFVITLFVTIAALH